MVPTNIVEGREQRVFRMAPGPDRKKDRSRTFEGIAEAMAAEAEELRRFAEGTLQNPDDFKWSADGPRYKALGNSFAVPVVRWLGERIEMVEQLCAERKAA